ncbi:MAG: hypothetical protein EAZ55_14865 [Cytophagales bacterium]|nr:MAG: hypothetical protein EAZ55_14865 [Cytophagales bacterium]
MNNIKLGLTLTGIKVAKGGCIVAGSAELSGVSASILNEQQRANLQKAYAAYNQVLDVAAENAGAIAETYNTIADLLKALRQKAKAVVDKINSGQKPSSQELKALQQMAKTATEAKKKELALWKEKPGADTSPYVSTLSTWLDQQQQGINCVNDLVAQAPAPKKGGPNQEWSFFVADCVPNQLLLEEPAAPKSLPCLGLFDDCDDIQTNLKLMHTALVSGGTKGVLVKTAQANKTLAGNNFSVEGIDISEMQMVFVGQVDVAHTLTMKEYEETATGFIIKADGKNVVEIKLSPNDLSGTPSTKDKLREYLFGVKKKTDPTAKFPITGKDLKEIFSGTDQSRCDEVAELINKYSDKFEINTPLRMSHFLGQIGVETGGLLELEEKTCYQSKARIKEVFGKVKYCDLFKGYEADLTQCDGDKPMPCIPPLKSVTSSLEVKDKYVCTAALIDYTYSCRMGNGAANTGDGSKFLGKGFIHLTGKSEFESISTLWNNDKENAGNSKDFAGKDIEQITNDLGIAIKASMYYWKKKSLNSFADSGSKDEDIDKLGARVNGTIYPALPNAYKMRRDLTNKFYNIFKK